MQKTIQVYYCDVCEQQKEIVYQGWSDVFSQTLGYHVQEPYGVSVNLSLFGFSSPNTDICLDCLQEAWTKILANLPTQL